MTARRSLNAFGAAACAGMLGYAFYAEKVLHLEPCPLCMFQRVGVAALGAVFLLAAILDPVSRGGARVHAALIALAAAFPAYVAGRHVYIQTLPAGSVPSCGATLDYMLEVFPLLEVVKKVLTGGGECARIDWSFLGLSMPAWVLISVLALAAVGLFANLRSGAPSRFWQVPSSSS
ncbi:MAG: disulfide bond formation protein B [Steroidobacteraceae bacterium]|jgi:disulfide bond formation protein DsbB|nr:disulfide bond formation protein B [Steroidobacteraceae bacterium]